MNTVCCFFGVLLLTIIATDMAKVFLSHKLGSMLHSRQIQYLNLITGFVFIISGSYIVYRFYSAESTCLHL